MKDTAQALDKPMVEPAAREERIREVAYYKFLARGGDDSDAAKDWFEAESEVDADEAER